MAAFFPLSLWPKTLPCPVPPGCHRGLWIAQSEPSPRCPTLPGQQSTEPPTRRAPPTSGRNMDFTIRTEVEGEEGWPTGTWLLDLLVRPRIRLIIGISHCSDRYESNGAYHLNLVLKCVLMFPQNLICLASAPSEEFL